VIQSDGGNTSRKARGGFTGRSPEAKGAKTIPSERDGGKLALRGSGGQPRHVLKEEEWVLPVGRRKGSSDGSK